MRNHRPFTTYWRVYRSQKWGYFSVYGTRRLKYWATDNNIRRARAWLEKGRTWSNPVRGYWATRFQNRLKRLKANYYA